jgi:DNA-binding CsgD family transcriptional regulator
MSGAAAERWSIADPALGRRLEVMVLPVGPRTADAPFSFTARRARVAVVLADPSDDTPLSAETLRSLLQLPPSLARLASAISAGKTIVDYADDAGLTEGTARQQLKDLLTRAGVRRQADLVRVLLSSVAALIVP